MVKQIIHIQILNYQILSEATLIFPLEKVLIDQTD